MLPLVVPYKLCTCKSLIFSAAFYMLIKYVISPTILRSCVGKFLYIYSCRILLRFQEDWPES